jgi:hypothetical protein
MYTVTEGSTEYQDILGPAESGTSCSILRLAINY